MMPRIIGMAAMSVAIFGASGCYTLRAAQGADIPNGRQIALDINDAGRLALGGAMGPEIARVEGRLQAKENNEYVIAVSSVDLLRGGNQVWKGERIRVRTEYVTRAYERRLSRGRTVVAATVGAGTVLFFVTRAIIGSGIGDEGMLPGDSIETVRRPVRP